VHPPAALHRRINALDREIAAGLAVSQGADTEPVLVDYANTGPVERRHDVVDQEDSKPGVGTAHAGQQSVGGLETESADKCPSSDHGDVPVWAKPFR